MRQCSEYPIFLNSLVKAEDCLDEVKTVFEGMLYTTDKK